MISLQDIARILRVTVVTLFIGSWAFGTQNGTEVDWNSRWIPADQRSLKDSDVAALESLVDLVSPTISGSIRDRGFIDGLTHHLSNSNPRQEVAKALNVLEERGHYESGYFQDNFKNAFRLCSSTESLSVRGMLRYSMGYKVVGISFHSEQHWKKEEGVFRSLSYPPSVESAIESLEQQGRPVLSIEDHYPIYILHYRQFSDICISKASSLLEAMGTFVHELIHVNLLTYTNPFFEVLDWYESKEDYVNKVVNERGHEGDAHISQYRAMALAKGSKDIIPSEVRGLFDDDMNFVETPENRKIMADFVIGPRGYRTLLENDYVELVVNLYNNLSSLKRMVERYKSAYESQDKKYSYLESFGNVLIGDFSSAEAHLVNSWNIGTRISDLEDLEEKIEDILAEIDRRIEAENLPVSRN